MSSVVTTSENGLRMKIKRKSSTGKIVSDVENISGALFKQKFVLDSDSTDRKKSENVTKLSAKILQAGKNKGRNKKQPKPLKEKKIKKRIHRVPTNINKCLPPTDKNSECLVESNTSKSNGSDLMRVKEDPPLKESISSSNISDNFSRSICGFPLPPDTTSSFVNPFSKSIEKKISSSERGTEAPTRDVETETTHVGVITDPDCLGPCEPGTSVVLEGIVWNESDNGILVVNVTWRGKTYVGTLMDSTKHHWAPPRFSEEELTSSNQYAYGGWGGANTHNQKSRNDETAAETRKPRRCRKDAAALASQNSRSSKTVSNSSNSTSTKENQPSVINESQSTKNKVGLFECQEMDCSKKFKHVAGLRYHQSHAHCHKKEKEKSSASESRSSPGKNSDKQPLRTKTPEENAIKMQDETTNKTSPSLVSDAELPPVVVSKSNQAEVSFEDISNKPVVDSTKSFPISDISSSLGDDLKTNSDIKDVNLSNSLVKTIELVNCAPTSVVENITKEVKPDEKVILSRNDMSPAPPILTRKDVCDLRVSSKESSVTSMDIHNSSEVKTNPPNVASSNPHRPQEFKEKKHSSFSIFSSQDSHKHRPSISPSSSSSSSSNAKKHHTAPESFPSSKRLKTSEESREEDHFYKAFRSMFEHSPLPLDYFIDPFYRAQSFSMMADPLLFHKSFDPRNKITKSSYDDLKPVDMSSKKAPTPKPEVPNFWPTYLPPNSSSQNSSHFFGSLKESDISSRSLNETFSSSLPSSKEKSLHKLQRFAPTGRYLDPSNRCPSTGATKDEGLSLKSYERDFAYKHKKNEDLPSQKNGKVKDDLRRPTPSSYPPKQDIFRSPLPPPPLLPSSFPFFSSQHPANYPPPHISPYSMDPLEKSPIHPRHQPSHLSPTVGERFKFPNSIEPLTPQKQGGSGGLNSGRSLASSLPSSSKSHLDVPPAPKHHLHTHHHTHIIKTPYPMYSQYAASLLTSPPIVPTVVVPEIFSPK